VLREVLRMDDDDDNDRRWHMAFEIVDRFRDVSPLVDLLRGDAPIPDGIRWSLAEMLAPSVRPLWNVRLAPRSTDSFQKNQSRLSADCRIAELVATRLRSGDTQEVAFAAVASNRRGMSEDGIKKAWLRASRRLPFSYLRIDPNEAVARYAEIRAGGIDHKSALAQLRREISPKGGRPAGRK
jgi:hypothetical protein